MQSKRVIRRAIVRAGLLVGLLSIVACGRGPEVVRDADAATTTPTAALRVLALGDSYTIGEGVPGGDRWPEQLADRLRDAGFDVSVDIVARTGWTTSELDRGIDAADPEGPFDLVTLQIGVNNQFRGLSIEDYRAEFAVLLDRAAAFAGGDPGRVVVVSIPDWGATPFGQSRIPAQVATAIDAFNRVAREQADRAGVAWVDVTAISRGNDPALVAADGLHPSAEQYRLWVDAILPVVEAILDR